MRMRSGKSIMFLCSCFSILLMSGCVHRAPLFHEPGDELPGTSIENQVKTWTRHSQLHDRWATTLDVSAIFLSWDLRHEMTEESIRIKNLMGPVATAIRDREQDLFRGYIDFYCAVYTTKPEWNDLDSDEPTWTVQYFNDQGTVVPAFRVEQTDLEPSLLFSCFPEITHWHRVYRVSFLRRENDESETILDSSTAWFGLRFSSYFGQSELRWHINTKGSKPASTND